MMRENHIGEGINRSIVGILSQMLSMEADHKRKTHIYIDGWHAIDESSGGYSIELDHREMTYLWVIIGGWDSRSKCNYGTCRECLRRDDYFRDSIVRKRPA